MARVIGTGLLETSPEPMPERQVTEDISMRGGDGSNIANDRHDQPTQMAPSATANGTGTKRNFSTVATARPTPAKRARPEFSDGFYGRRTEESRSQFWMRVKEKALRVYDYDDCPLKDGHIRLLFLKPNEDPEADIVVELKSYPMAELAAQPEAYQYTALSYNWGDGDASKTVLVDMSATNQRQTTDLKFRTVVELAMAAKGVAGIATEAADQVVRNVRTLAVKPNLYTFLQQFRQPKDEVALWVDRICINQGSNKEKQDQVSRMHNIYATASNVSIWLGPADEGRRSDRAMDFIRTILEGDDIGTKLTVNYAQHWADLLNLMRRRWFSRRWIIQELALAKSVEVRCGSKATNWKDFADAVSIFVLYFDTILAIVRTKPELEESLEGIRDIKPLGARILVDVLSNTFQRHADGAIYEPRKGLETLISSLSTFETSDPRDTVYTLLNLARESFKPPTQIVGTLTGQYQQSQRPNPPPEPDYSIDLLEVYTIFIRWCITESNSLDILCRHWALPELKKPLDAFYPRIVELPSWIKTVRDSAYGPQIKGFGGRRTGDSFVGSPDHRFYNASLGRAPMVTFGRYDPLAVSSPPHPSQTTDSAVNGSELSVSPHPQRKPSYKRKIRRPRGSQDSRSTLTVRGICIGLVSEAHFMTEGTIPKHVLETLGHSSGSTELESVPDTVWRTLVADRDADGKMPPAWYHRACMTCLVADTQFGNLDTNKILSRKNTEKTEILVSTYLKRVQAVCWNRAFLDIGPDDADETDTPAKSLVGIGPEASKTGDLVCILFGCSVPCILSPVWDPNPVGPQPPAHYQLVGEAFVLGQMDGEAIADLSEEELNKKAEEFKLR